MEASKSSTTTSYCPICGSSKSLKWCGSCKKVGYCSRDHQRQHWKLHRADCSIASKQPAACSQSTGMVVVVEVKRGEGNGTTNPMVNHTFDSYAQAKNYAKERFGVSKDEVLKELTEMPFLTELMGFRSATLFVDPHYNSFPPHIPKWLNCSGNDKLNAMAIYLGCAVSHGLSLHLNASGDAFFIGTTSANQPVTSNVLWGAASLVSQAMAYYPDEYLEKPRAKAFRKWSHEYARGTWKPNAEDDSINLYQTDPFQCDWESVDHRIAST